jgi:two-component system sensor histidine kinase CpxA
MRFRIRSIFTKILLWFVATVSLSLAGYVMTSTMLSERLMRRDSSFQRISTVFLDDARRAYEEGGKTELAKYLDRLDAHSDSQHFLTDGRGIDLVSGEDRSDLRRARRPASQRFLPPWLATNNGPIVRVRTSNDNRFRLVTVYSPPPRMDPFESLQYFLWLPLLIGVLGYLLASHLASPLRNLRKVVERFGRGELGLRFHLARRDEIGELARSFNRMADQITTLMTAERRLLQDVSHELRSPLARLGFAIELAKTSNDREGALTRIRKEGDRLNQLVDELLHLTRAEGDPAARNKEEIELSELLEDVIADCEVEAEAQGCRLRTRISHSAILMGDHELLRRACENVLRNAIRHAPPSSFVETTMVVQAGVAKLTIRDFGPGVPTEALAEIFKPFYRVEKDRGRSSGGMGLGLTIANRAVELHKGRLSARNAGPGLMVEIELPIDRSELSPIS